MSSIIRIKRSEVSGNPNTLAAGELAYSALANNDANGGDRLYIGIGTETSGNAANHIIIGGKYYTGLIDAGGTGGTLNTSARSVPVLSASGTIDQWLVGNLKLSANALISTNTNGDISITPNGTGKTIVSNLYIGDNTTTLQEYIYDQVGGTVTQGTGISVTYNDASNTTTIAVDSTIATKAYVDAFKTGLNVKDATRAATTSALTVTYSNGSSGVGATLTNAGTQSALVIDGVTLVANDRVLVKDQVSALQNGIYTVTNTGSVSTNWVLTRATDFDQSPTGEVAGGDFVFVQEGTLNADVGYVVTTDGIITLGTTAISWTQFSGAGQIVAGAGLIKTGSTIDIIGAANRITVNPDSIDIASTYVGQTSITTLGTIGTGTWQGTLIGPTYGGTGVNNGSNTLTMAGSVTHAGAFTQTFTATGNTNVTLPTTGTLATLAGTETFTNKTLTSPTINGGTLSGTFSGNHTLSGITTLSNTTDASNTTTAGVVISGGLAVAKKIYVGSSLIGAGAATSTLDGFAIDGGTY